MDPNLLRRLAAGACVAMALVLVLLQFVLTPESRAPTFLFVLFTGLWVFGAVMLFVAPVFGAVGTAAWGVIAAIGNVSETHASMAAVETVGLVAGSLATAALAVAFLIARRSASRRA